LITSYIERLSVARIARLSGDMLNAAQARHTTPLELSEQFWAELCELRSAGEISGEFARQIVDDLFDPSSHTRPRLVRSQVWATYVENLLQGAE
jgi:hypothetical protein